MRTAAAASGSFAALILLLMVVCASVAAGTSKPKEERKSSKKAEAASPAPPTNNKDKAKSAKTTTAPASPPSPPTKDAKKARQPQQQQGSNKKGDGDTTTTAANQPPPIATPVLGGMDALPANQQQQQQQQTGTAGNQPGSPVLELTYDTFDAEVAKHDLMLVEFYAPWCGHCKELAPEYETAAAELQLSGITLAKVDATKEPELKDKFSIKGYPTIKVFRRGIPADYSGGRKAEDFVAFMKQQLAGPSCCAKISDVEKLKSTHVIAVIGFFDEADSEEVRTFRSLENSQGANMKDIGFGEVTSGSLCKHYRYTMQIVLFIQNLPYLVYDGDLENITQMLKWLKVNTVPPPGEISAENEQIYLAEGLPVLKVFFDCDKETNPKQTAYYITRLKQLYTEFKGEMVFGVSNIFTSISSTAAMKYGDLTGLKLFVAIEDREGQVYTLKLAGGKQPSLKDMRRMVQDFFAGKLKHLIRSAPVDPNYKGVCKQINGDTFEKVMWDRTKNKFLMFYADWSEYTKAFDPDFERLCESAADMKNLVVAKFDAQNNDWPKKEFNLQGYPGLYFVSKNNEVMIYNGERGQQPIWAWIMQQVRRSESKQEL